VAEREATAHIGQRDPEAWPESEISSGVAISTTSAVEIYLPGD
jgi:hypothetical protein